jgi:hypothetical protein
VRAKTVLPLLLAFSLYASLIILLVYVNSDWFSLLGGITSYFAHAVELLPLALAVVCMVHAIVTHVRSRNRPPEPPCFAKSVIVSKVLVYLYLFVWAFFFVASLGWSAFILSSIQYYFIIPFIYAVIAAPSFELILALMLLMLYYPYLLATSAHAISSIMTLRREKGISRGTCCLLILLQLVPLVDVVGYLVLTIRYGKTIPAKLDDDKSWQGS